MRVKLTIAAVLIAIAGVFVVRTALLRLRGQARPLVATSRMLAELRLDHVRLADALAEWSRLSGVRTEANWDSLGEVDFGPDVDVTLRLFDRPAAQALEAIFGCASAHHERVRYRWRGDAASVAIALENALPDPPGELRMYDVSKLLGHFGTSAAPELPAASVAGTRFASPERRFETIEKLLMQVVDSNSWRDYGGAAGSLEEHAGRLFVFQTPANHLLIEHAVANLVQAQVLLQGQQILSEPLEVLDEHRPDRDLRRWADEDDACRVTLDRIVPEFVLEGATFQQAIVKLQELTRANVAVRWASLGDHGIDPADRRRLALYNLPLGRVLNALVAAYANSLAPPPTWQVQDGIVWLAPGGPSVTTLLYDVRDLAERLILPNDPPPPQSPGLFGNGNGGVILFSAGPNAQQWMQVRPSLVSGAGATPSLAPAEAAAHERARSALAAARAAGGPVSNLTRQECVDSLVRLIEETVDPNAWRDNGGQVGAIWEVEGVLVVMQTTENHHLIVSLLRNLRQLRDDADRGVPPSSEPVKLFPQDGR
jgi:hypothetical protein